MVSGHESGPVCDHTQSFGDCLDIVSNENSRSAASNDNEGNALCYLGLEFQILSILTVGQDVRERELQEREGSQFVVGRIRSRR